MSVVAVSRKRAEFYLFSVTIVWGSTFFLTKLILESASPFVYIAMRFFIATVLFGACSFQHLRSLSRHAVIKGSVLGILLFIGFVTQCVGLKYTSASRSAFITGLSVLFTPILQLIIDRRFPKLGNILGVIIVAIGLYIMTSPSGSAFNIGDVLTLLCAISFAVYIVYMDVHNEHDDPSHLSFIQFVSTTIFSAVCIPLVEVPFLHLHANFIWILLYLSIMPTIVALYVQAKYQRFTTPTRTAVIFSMEPPIAAMFAILAGQERLSWVIMAGGGLILLGLLLSELSDVIFHPRINIDKK